MKIHEITESKKQLDEILPALAIGGAGAALTASELYQMKQAYDRGEMSAADIAKQVGTDIAATVAGLGAIKLQKQQAQVQQVLVISPLLLTLCRHMLKFLKIKTEYQRHRRRKKQTAQLKTH